MCEKFVSLVYGRPDGVGEVEVGSCAHFDQPNSSFSLSGQIRLVWFCRIVTRMVFYLDFFSWMKGAPLGRQRKGLVRFQEDFKPAPFWMALYFLFSLFGRASSFMFLLGSQTH